MAMIYALNPGVLRQAQLRCALRLNDRIHISRCNVQLYQVVVKDFFNGRALGFSMGAQMPPPVRARCQMLAAWQRGKPIALPHHSDWVRQYSSEYFQWLLA